MNIVVCVKQVPDVSDIKWTKENNLDRANMLSRLNQNDEWAIDYAVKIKKQFKDVTITALSMGPTQAMDVVKYAIAKGADKGILLSDKLFSGSDTYATAKILACAISKIIKDYDIVLTGQIASDGDTAQTPVSLAQMLDIPDVTNVVEIHNADKNTAIVSQKINNVINMFEVSTPCLIAVKKPLKETYKPKIDDYIRAQDVLVNVVDAGQLDLKREDIGITGSPTMVYRAFKPEFSKNTVEIKDNITKQIVELMLKVNE